MAAMYYYIYYTADDADHMPGCGFLWQNLLFANGARCNPRGVRLIAPGAAVVSIEAAIFKHKINC